MGILSDFFIADGPGVPDYQGGQAVPAEDRCQLKSITPLEAAGMLAVLRGDDDCLSLLDEFEVLTPEDAEEWTMSVPSDMVQRLAAIGPSEVSAVAAEFATATIEELGWSQDDFEPVVSELSALAKRAIESGKNMYLWNCL